MVRNVTFEPGMLEIILSQEEQKTNEKQIDNNNYNFKDEKQQIKIKDFFVVRFD